MTKIKVTVIKKFNPKDVFGHEISFPRGEIVPTCYVFEEWEEFIIENFLFGDNDSLSEETSFLEDGIIDSTGILELVAFIEDTFGITVEDEELVPENLDSVKNVAQYIEQKKRT